MLGKHEFDGRGFLFFVVFFVLIVAIWQTALFSVRSLEQLAYERIAPQSAAQVMLAIPPSHTKASRDNIILGFVGDIMLDRGVADAVKNYGAGDYRFPFTNTRDDLRKYDILFGNLEGPISDKGTNQWSLYSFRMNPEALHGILDAGFDVFSIANNHIGDWGAGAIADTMERLESNGIIPIGVDFNATSVYQPRVVSQNGVRVAYVAFSELETIMGDTKNDSPNIALIGNGEKMVKSINEAKSIADIVVVSFHFGDEYKSEPNEFQQRIAKRAIDAGADIVVGHHSHVVQPLEYYGNGYIAYSLGNFVFDQSFSEETMTGAVLEVLIEKKKIQSARYRTIKLNDHFQPAFVD